MRLPSGPGNYRRRRWPSSLKLSEPRSDSSTPSGPSSNEPTGMEQMVSSDPAEQAKAAREHSKGAFLSAIDQGITVRKLSEKMVEHARRNHFGEGLERIWTKGTQQR